MVLKQKVTKSSRLDLLRLVFLEALDDEEEEPAFCSFCGKTCSHVS